MAQVRITPEDVEAAKALARRKTVDNANDHPLLRRASDIAWMVPYWDQVDDIVEGKAAIKAQGDKYLPTFPEEAQADHNFRLQVSKFTNIYRDTLEGLATKPFQEEVSILGGEKVPEAVYAFAEDVDGAGNNLSAFASLTFFNGINSALDWILVDYPTIDKGAMISVAEAKARNLKPYWTHILARNVFEVRTTVIGAKEMITYIRIFEPGNDAGVADRVRFFERDAVTGKIKWELWEKQATYTKPEDQMKKLRDGELSIDVIPMIPFITGRRDGRSYKFLPAMRDASDLQITLYQDESALQFIKTMAGYPMLSANGIKPELDAQKKPVRLAIGPMKVLYAPPSNDGSHGEWKFIEPSANSMEFLQKNIDKTKQDLRELGRQPLTALSTQLTTTTTSIAAGKAKSAVTTWALALKDALENALLITMKYMNDKFEPEVYVYTGFDNLTEDGKDLDTLNAARDRGDLSQDTYWGELKRRGVLSPEFKPEDEVKRLLTETPVDDGEDEDADDQERQQRKPKAKPTGDSK